MQTPCFDSVKIACITLGGKPIARGSFPVMKAQERDLLRQGYSKQRLHVGYAPYYNGVVYCKKCSDKVVKPWLSEYEGHKYYTCACCGTLNYI